MTHFAAMMAAAAGTTSGHVSQALKRQMYEDQHDDFDGSDDVQQAMWMGPPYTPYSLGHVPVPIRLPRPDLRPPTSLLETESFHLSPAFKEFMRQQIRDTEWDEVQFRGERAAYRTAMQRRRVPIINNPNSSYTHWMLGRDQQERDDEPPLVYKPATTTVIRSRRDSRLYNVWLDQEQPISAIVASGEMQD